MIDAKPRRPRGSGGMTERRPGLWRITWPVRGALPGEELVTGSRIDAERVLRRRLNERDTGGGHTDHRLTLGAWLDTWLGSHVEGKAQGTVIRYRDLSERVIKPALGSLRLADIDAEAIARFKAQMMARGRSARGADSIVDVLSAALGQAVESGKLGHNPRGRVKRAPKGRPIIDPPTRAECEAILRAVAGDPVLYAAFALSIGHGLRQSELLGLRRGDRSADGRTLSITRKREYRTGRLDEEPKDGSARKVILLPWIAAALDALGPGAPGSLLFPGSRPGTTLHPHTLLDRMHELSASLGLRRRYTWHDLRRAYGTRIGALNSPATVMAAMGHRDYRTSLLYIAPGEVLDTFAEPTNEPTTSETPETPDAQDTHESTPPIVLKRA